WLRDSHGSDPGEYPMYHDCPGTRGGRARYRSPTVRRGRCAVVAGLGRQGASMTGYRALFDRVLSRVDPETAHRAALVGMRAAGRVPVARSWAARRFAPVPSQADHEIQALGLRFSGPLGLAAGFDKNAEGVDALAALGFSFIEVGTVTARPQPGNPRPRLFRLRADHAIVNRMGFNNDGAAAVAARLAKRRRRRRSLPVVVGVNIGKSRDIPAAHAVADYEASTRLLAPYADYLVINVSSPNTPGLR